MALTPDQEQRLQEHLKKIPFQITPTLAKVLWSIKIRMEEGKKKRDCIILIDGPEGSGKTVLAGQVGFFFQPESFGIKNYAWSPVDFIERFNELPKFHPMLFDEAVTGFLSIKRFENDYMRLQLFLNTCRSQQKIIICTFPRFYEQDRTLAVERSRMLLHTFDFGIGGEESRYHFYNGRQKEKLYHMIKTSRDSKAKKRMSITQVYEKNSVRRFMHFPNYWVVNEDEYEKNKRKELMNYIDDKPVFRVEKFRPAFKHRGLLIRALHDKFGQSYYDIGRILDCEYQTVVTMRDWEEAFPNPKGTASSHSYIGRGLNNVIGLEKLKKELEAENKEEDHTDKELDEAIEESYEGEEESAAPV